MGKKQLRRLRPESLYPHCAMTPRHGMCARKNDAMKSHPGIRRKEENTEGGKGEGKGRGTDGKRNKRQGRGAKGGRRKLDLSYTL